MRSDLGYGPRVTASLFGRDRLILANEGGAPAFDVSLEVETPDQQESPIVESEIATKLPKTELSPGGQIELLTAFTFGSAAHFTAIVRWKTPDGEAGRWVGQISP